MDIVNELEVSLSKNVCDCPCVCPCIFNNRNLPIDPAASPIFSNDIYIEPGSPGHTG